MLTNRPKVTNNLQYFYLNLVSNNKKNARKYREIKRTQPVSETRKIEMYEIIASIVGQALTFCASNGVMRLVYNRSDWGSH